MDKSSKPDINDLILKSLKRSIRKAIDTACRTKTSLIVEKNGKIIAIKPKYKYVRVPIKTAKKSSTRRQKKG